MPSPSNASISRLNSSEVIVGTLAVLTMAITTWGYAGRASWAPTTFTALSALTVFVSIWLSHRENRPVRGSPFVPVLTLATLLTASLLNPSHLPVINYPGRWLEREAWVTWLPTTVDRATTLQLMLPWISALLLYAALRQTPFSRRAIRLLWLAFLVHGTSVAVVGIYFHVTTPYETLGLIRDRHGYHFASFIYRNHWAAAVILLVPIAIGFAFSALGKWKRDRGHFDAVLGGFGIALLLTLTLPIPGSRSGLIVVGGILGFALLKLVILILQSRRAANKRSKFIIITTLAVFTSLILTGSLILTKTPLEQHWQRTKQQLKGISSGHSDLRLELTRDTLRMTADRPIWGWGVGSLGIVFQQYQGNYLRDKHGRISARVVHAHNDWAQISAETGGIGVILFICFILGPIRNGWRSDSILERWVTSGIVILLFYASVDFPLHNPAVLLMVAILLSSVGRSKYTYPIGPQTFNRLESPNIDHPRLQ
jgi:O-antigen ligase